MPDRQDLAVVAALTSERFLVKEVLVEGDGKHTGCGVESGLRDALSAAGVCHAERAAAPLLDEVTGLLMDVFGLNRWMKQEGKGSSFTRTRIHWGEGR